jgi:predicted P-type ATPase
MRRLPQEEPVEIEIGASPYARRLILNETVESGSDRIPCRWTAKNRLNVALYYLGCLLTGGLLYVLCVLYPKWKDSLQMTLCDPDAAETATIYVDGKLESGAVTQCYVENELMSVTEIRCKRYFADSRNNWDLLAVPDVPKNFEHFLAKPSTRPRSAPKSRDVMEKLYGPNSMTLPEVAFLTILVRQILHPFYLFQYFAVIVWIIQGYVMYSIIILLITAGAVYMTTTEIVYNLRRLHDLAGKRSVVSLLLDGGLVESRSDALIVPGDLLIITPGLTLPCDIVLKSGRVTVDESMLTGESVPVTKMPFDLQLIENSGQGQVDFGKYSGNILYGGTRVLQVAGTDSPAGNPLGVVYKTGFRSAKGQLVATLLNPKEEFMGFFSDAISVVIFMFFLATVLFCWTGTNLRQQSAGWGLVFLKYLDAVTIAVPPALTASLTVATSIAVSRLKNKDIYVSETSRVNWAGICSAVCFDKTGTLTEDRLVFESVYVPKELITAEDRRQRFPTRELGASHASDIAFSELSGGKLPSGPLVPRGPDANAIPQLCLEVMSTCHSLAVVDGRPVGDPLEVELLRASGWTLELSSSGSISALSGPPSDHTRHKICRHFEFTADKLRAGTLLQRPSKEYMYVCKGSPETILKLADPASVPADVSTELEKLAKNGLRVIAIGYRKCPECESDLLTMKQEELERSLKFLGLVSMSNALKSDTYTTIETLKGAEIHCNMITGDHIHTAIAIAFKCGLLTSRRRLFLIDVDVVENAEKIIVLDLTDYSVVEGAHDPPLNPNVLDVLSLVNRAVSEHSFHIPQVSVSGRGLVALRAQFPQLVPGVIRCTQVFARMKPADKQFIVEELMKNSEELVHQLDESISLKFDDSEVETTSRLIGGHNRSSSAVPQDDSMDSSRASRAVAPAFEFIDDGRGNLHVVFCGDGANDMSALRAATVGVSLCESETSVAAPVTSRLQTPQSVVDVLKEGRCSLITAYVLICFNIMYAVVQLFMVCQMYNLGLRVGNMTYLIQDLFFTLVLGLAISVTPPAKKLEIELPPQKFFTRYFCFKLFSQLLCFPVFQLIALWALSLQDFYHRFDSDGHPLEYTYAYESSTIADIGLAQLMIASVVSTVDHPFRDAWYSNKYHVILLFLQGSFVLYQIFARKNQFIVDTLEIRPLPYNFGFILLGIITANACVSFMLARVAEVIRVKTGPSSTK